MTEISEFILTTSPSMDILISSNLERLIYRIAGEDAARTTVELMEAACKMTVNMRSRQR